MWGDGFLRFRTPDRLTLSRGVLVKHDGCVLAGDSVYNDWNVRNFFWMVCSRMVPGWSQFVVFIRTRVNYGDSGLD